MAVSEVKELNSNGEEQVLHNIYLREKFKDFQKSLENEFSNMIDKRLGDFEEENLPVAECLELLAINHMESIYNIFVAILVLLFFNKVLEEIVHTGSPNLDLSLIIWAFGGLDRVIVIWVCMFTSTSVLVYLSFHHWAHYRHNMPAVYDSVGGIIYIAYLSLFLYLPLQSLLYHELPPASSFIILCEQVRMFMKTWAFVRSNLNRAIKYKKNDDCQAGNLCPDFSYYLYFLFAPTLVYRDEYPRNETCDWQQVFNDLSQDWWNSTSYARFYRTWNCVVHDWLYEYVYRDIVAWQRKQGEGCARLRCFPMLVVFFISSVVHEYILAFAFKFFYPVLLVMFGGFGVAFMFVNSKARQFNIFLWVTLIFGTGVLMCLYSMEWYARINCPPEGYLDYLVPRSLACEFSS
ncbi:Sterol O-acyltransferase 1-like [Homarus americanus]|uniref:O-acyltransferase n=1 Tax=Homarus americanus TaxID=6706 RepID=A0A8J5JXG1_HOMAM|nr:Sterol O-acyltransferase 1-like [Homarus americanus]